MLIDSADSIFAFYKACLSKNCSIASISVHLRHTHLSGLLEIAQSAQNNYLLHTTPSLDITHLFVNPIIEHTSSGPERFKRAESFTNDLFKKIGLTQHPVYLAYSFCFFDESQESNYPFEPLSCFLPEWHAHIHTQSPSILTLNTILQTTTNLYTLAQSSWEKINQLQQVNIIPTVHDSCIYPQQSFNHNIHPFASNIEKAITQIHHNKYQKIVIGNCTTLPIKKPIHVPTLAKKLESHFPTCSTFIYKKNTSTYFFGATPETLLQCQNDQICIDALAGSLTTDIPHTPDAKLLQEHHYVVQDIVDTLIHLNIHPTYNPVPQYKILPNITHLHTNIQGTLPDDYSIFKIIEALHPTPALGGYPKEEVIKIIPQLEHFSRGLYGGCLGWVNTNNDSHCTVNIRCGLANDNSITLYAGCGITQDSDIQTECQENITKLQTLLPCL